MPALAHSAACHSSTSFPAGCRYGSILGSVSGNDATYNASAARTHVRVSATTSTNMSSMWFVVRDASAPRRDTMRRRTSTSTTQPPAAVSAAVSQAWSELLYHCAPRMPATRDEASIERQED